MPKKQQFPYRLQSHFLVWFVLYYRPATIAGKNCPNEWTFKNFDWKSFWIRLLCFCHLIDYWHGWNEKTCAWKPCLSGESGFGQTDAGLAIAHQAAADDKLETSHPSADPQQPLLILPPWTTMTAWWTSSQSTVDVMPKQGWIQSHLSIGKSPIGK